MSQRAAGMISKEATHAGIRESQCVYFNVLVGFMSAVVTACLAMQCADGCQHTADVASNHGRTVLRWVAVGSCKTAYTCIMHMSRLQRADARNT